MLVNAADLAARDAYLLMIACVVPRPIGWISTIDTSSDPPRPNLAPFSYFGGVSSKPPTVMLSVGRRRGDHKDTSRNLLQNGEAVVHIPTRSLAQQMVATSAELPAGENEFAFAGLNQTPATSVRAPRVADAAIAMEARVVLHREVGEGPVDMFLLEISHFHLADDVLVDGLPDPALLAAVGRLGGTSYCDTSTPFDVERPTRV